MFFRLLGRQSCTGESSCCRYRLQLPPMSVAWKRPSSGQVKFNTNASLRMGVGASIARALRNMTGGMIW